jgi:hypothetical protein
MSDSSDSESDSDADEKSDQSMSLESSSDEDGEEEEGGNNIKSIVEVSVKHDINKIEAPIEVEKEEEAIDEDSIPIFAYQMLESSETAPVPQELINIFSLRNDLFWALQCDLLVKWFNGKKLALASSVFPAVVAKNLYTLLYSSDEEILSYKASETLASLYTQFTTEVGIAMLVFIEYLVFNFTFSDSYIL